MLGTICCLRIKPPPVVETRGIPPVLRECPNGYFITPAELTEPPSLDLKLWTDPFLEGITLTGFLARLPNDAVVVFWMAPWTLLYEPTLRVDC